MSYSMKTPCIRYGGSWKCFETPCTSSFNCQQRNAKDRYTKKRQQRIYKMNGVQLCNWMIAEEKRKKLKGRCAGRFAIWFPRSEKTNNILQPPKGAIDWDFFGRCWLFKEENRKEHNMDWYPKRI